MVVTAPSRVGRVDFTVVDEAIHLLDTPAEPWSVHLEARVAGSLHDARLRAAVAAALQRHPMARARVAVPRRGDRRLAWEFPDEPDVDPLRVVDCPDDDALAAARSRLCSLAIPLGESPPFRLRLAHAPSGDVLLLSASHAAFDGFGALRLLRSIARAYAGAPEPRDSVGFSEVRRVEEHLGTRDPAVKSQRLASILEKLRDVVDPPARLAPDGGTDRPGYGLHHVTLGPERTGELVEVEVGGTVNDLLVAALHAAIARWNAEHGADARSRISVLVPVNLRPKEWREDGVTNFTLPVRVSTSATDRSDAAGALEAVRRQTESMKRAGTAAALIEVLDVLPALPLRVKRALPALVAATGNRLVDTAELSNLGELDEPPSFGAEAGETTEVWFSPPGRMPLGLALGVTTVSGRMHLAFRYRHPQFGRAAAARFADAYLAELDRLAALGR